MDGDTAEDYVSQKPSAPALCRRAFVNMASEAGEKRGDGIDQGIVDPRCQQDGEDKKPAPISFGFSKTSTKFKTSSNLNESEREERDYLTGVEEKELKSTKPVEQKKELVIPLIVKNQWVKQEKPKKEPLGSKDCPPSQEQDSVESQAIKELVEESRRQLDEWKNGTQEVLDLTIPLLMQNQVPQGFEDGDRVRVDLRPESSTDADYESVPVEAYGLAMLKGMGWKEDEGIGRTFKQVVKPIEHQLRPKGLGLGADRSALKDLEPSGPRRPPKPGEDRSQEELVLAPGASVLLEAGAHKDHYGKVEGMDPDNARVMVKLAIGGKTVTVSQYNIRLVGRKEYDRNAKDLSRHSKAHMEAEKEKERERERKKEKKREEREERNEQQQRSKEKKDKRKHADSREKTPPAKLPRQEPPTPCWLQRDLRVRFIDKTFKGGKYYNSKMTVEDVLTPRTCVCRTEEGRLLDGVKQEMLETMVPKSESDCIMVVLGEHRGQVGRILQRDKERCRAMVQLDRHEEKIYTLDYDSICHYVGGGYA